MTEKIQTEAGYIKLYKNTKGYNWEIKAHEVSDIEYFYELIKIIKELNNKMLDEFTEISV